MNNILAATTDWNLLLQYIVYGGIILVSIILLIALRKSARLPKHTELKKRLAALHDDIAAIAPHDRRMSFIKSISRTVYKADNLAYIAAILAEKERYADLSRISTLVNDARSELLPYKFGKREAEDDGGIKQAAQLIESALAVIDGVIERDARMGKAGK